MLARLLAPYTVVNLSHIAQTDRRFTPDRRTGQDRRKGDRRAA
jgi:hypothetical protein